MTDLAHVRAVSKWIAANANSYWIQNVLLLRAAVAAASLDNFTSGSCDVRQCLKGLHNWNVTSVVHDRGRRVAHLRAVALNYSDEVQMEGLRCRKQHERARACSWLEVLAVAIRANGWKRSQCCRHPRSPAPKWACRRWSADSVLSKTWPLPLQSLHPAQTSPNFALSLALKFIFSISERHTGPKAAFPTLYSASKSTWS